MAARPRTENSWAHFRGRTPRWPTGSGVLGLYGGLPNLPRKRYRETVHRTGQLLGTTIQTLQDATGKTYTPANNSTYPGGSYGERL